MERHFSALYPADTRFDEVKKVLGYVQAGNVSQILGIAGIGRTIFLGLLAFNKKVKELHLKEKAGEYHFVLVDFTPLKGESLSEVAKSILLATFQSLRERQLLEDAAFVENVFRENNTAPDANALFQGVHKVVDYLAHERGLSIVFLFDSFEVYAPYLDPKFFDHLTTLRDHMRYRLSFVFSLNRPLETVVDRELVSQVEQLVSGHTIWLSLSDSVCNDFLKEFLEQQFSQTIDSKDFSHVLTVTGGHAKLVKVLLEEALQQGSVPTIENKAIQSVCYEIWDTLHVDEQSLLIALASGKKDELADTTRAYLLEAHLLTGEDRFSIPLFQEFISRKTGDVKMGAFSYRENTNDLLKGSTSITENFTASEFRLLSYLLSHKEQVVEREALIAAAWKDTKSIAGVTEQALDQLVYRVRKKIEEDPNNPTHLLTIKGRGFKFNP